MRRPDELTRDELLAIVRTVRGLLFAADDGAGTAVWDPDREVAGADFVQEVAAVMGRFDLTPAPGPVAGY